MSRISKPLLCSALALAAVGVVAGHRVVTAQRTELSAREAEAARLAAEIRTQRESLAQGGRDLSAVEQEAARARAALAEAEAGSALKLWANRIALLKRLLGEMPGQAIPELRLLTPADWVHVARAHELDSPGDIRTALAGLRAIARKLFAPKLQEALRRFLASSDGELPQDILQLAPHLPPPADIEMLRRYTMARSGRYNPDAEPLIRESATSDLILTVGLTNWSIRNNSDFKLAESETDEDALTRAATAIGTAVNEPGGNASKVAESVALGKMFAQASAQVETIFGGEEVFGQLLKTAVRRFTAAQPGEPVTDLAQLLPYLERSERFVTLARPFFAQLAYMRDHQGQMPTDPAQLQRYLAQPFRPEIALRMCKITTEGERVTMNISTSTP